MLGPLAHDEGQPVERQGVDELGAGGGRHEGLLDPGLGPASRLPERPVVNRHLAPAEDAHPSPAASAAISLRALAASSASGGRKASPVA